MPVACMTSAEDVTWASSSCSPETKTTFCSRRLCSVTSRNVPVWNRGAPPSSRVSRMMPEYQRYSPSRAQRHSISATPSFSSDASEADAAAWSSGWMRENASGPSISDSWSGVVPVMAASDGLM